MFIEQQIIILEGLGSKRGFFKKIFKQKIKQKLFKQLLTGSVYLKSSFPKRYKSILIVFMKMTFFYLDPYILLIFNLSS